MISSPPGAFGTNLKKNKLLYIMDTEKKRKIVTCFNTKFGEFLRDLSNTFPEDNDFKVFRNGFNLLKLASENQPIQTFKFFAEPYKSKILEKDENFFLQNKFEKEMLTVEAQENVTEELIEKLKGYWATMSDENKEIVWNYLQLLLKLTTML
jgi:hypothetical protein